jgi:predicted AlkP superfamily pyrophosphatase or phosphodiesterase
MKRVPVRITPSIALLLLLAASTGFIAPQARTAGSPHVVIISLDGFAGWALDDPHLPVPTLRRLAASGAWAKRMRPVDPTVTWANHTSMVTGVTPAKHGVIFNGLLMRDPGALPRVEPWRDKAEMVKARTLYDVAHARGLTTAQVDWVAILNAPTITWEFPERPDPKGQVARELVQAGILSESDLESFATQNILFRDHIWTQAAAHILRQHRPNLLMFHLLNLDSTQHRYGPRTPAAMNAMAYIDTQVATIVRALETTGLSKSTSLFVVSDHGFKAVKRQIRPNAALQKTGLLTTEKGKISKADVYSIPEGGTALVYVLGRDPSGALMKRAKAVLSGMEGLETIVEAADYPRFGLPKPDESDQMGQLMLVAKDGYAFTGDASEPQVVDAPAGSLGAHGYIATDPDLRALFIASGRGIRSGVVLDEVATVDVGPTMARLLGLDLGPVDGKALTDILGPLTTATPARQKK